MMFFISKITISIALAGVILPLIALDKLEEWRSFKISKVLSFLMLFSAVFLFYSGLSLSNGWEEIMISRDGVAISDAKYSGRRGGIVIFLIQYWPYILMTIGMIMSYVGIKSLRRFITLSKKAR